MLRKGLRATYDRAQIYRMLDEALTASVAVVLEGAPRVQPMIPYRDGDCLILHGHFENELLSVLGSGAEACINVTFVDAFALARSVEGHSLLYRSATIYGRGETVADERAKLELMERVFASLVGKERLSSLPSIDPAYLRFTLVVRVRIDEAVGKVNHSIETAQGGGALWSGLVPLSCGLGAPLPDHRTSAEQRVAPELSAFSRLPPKPGP